MNERPSRISHVRMLSAPVRALDRFNARHPYSHNDYFHPWIVRNLPRGRDRALDLGCGEGLLASVLAGHFTHVTAADSDPQMRAATNHRCRGLPVTVVDGFDDAGSAGARYDAITMIASLHHLSLRPTLRRCRDLLAPGGRLLVVGLARSTLTPRDLLWELGSAVVNPVIGYRRHPRPDRSEPSQPAYPMRDPVQSVDEIHAAAHDVLGDVDVRRRIPFRYTLLWQKPHLN